MLREAQTAINQLIEELRPEPTTIEKPFSISNFDDNRIIDTTLASDKDGKITDLLNGKWDKYYPSQSEADQALCNAIARHTQDTEQVNRLFRKSGLYRLKWDEKHYGDGRTYGEVTIEKAIESVQEYRRQGTSKKDVAGLVRGYLLEGDGGVFRIADLKRELNLNDYEYTLARQCVHRMESRGEIEKHGQSLGSYRVISKNKQAIAWDEVKANPSDLLLPGNLQDVAIVRDGDLIAVAGFKNHNKTALAVEIARLNLPKFKVHFFITEYSARMKGRLLDFGIDLHHPNFKAYPIEKSDYIPDKIESGHGVLNIIDHFPNLDNFYLVGKVQDEILRNLNGAICFITHQKLKAIDEDAIGGSFWRIAPTLAITLFNGDSGRYGCKMKIVKGKEPASGKGSIEGMMLHYNLYEGHRFDYDSQGWGYQK